MKQLNYVFIFIIIVFLITAITKHKLKGGTTSDDTDQNNPDTIIDNILSKTNHGSWNFKNILNTQQKINNSIILCFKKDATSFLT